MDAALAAVFNTRSPMRARAARHAPHTSRTEGRPTIMSRICRLLPILIGFTLSSIGACAAPILKLGKFDATVYAPTNGEVRSVAIVFPDPSHPGASLEAIAHRLQGLNTLVIGIDVDHLAAQAKNDAGGCLNPAHELPLLVQRIEQRSGVQGYIEPMLVGVGSGAALAFRSMVSAPMNTFKGGVVVDFCPTLDTPVALCASPGSPPEAAHAPLKPVATFNAPFSVVVPDQGEHACPPTMVKAFFGASNGATLVPVPATTAHGGWLPQFQEAYLRIAGSDANMRTAVGDEPEALKDIPLTEVVNPSAPKTDTFAVFYSGDGGWATLDADVSAHLAAAGIPVVGVSSLKYFWSERTPAQLGRDLERIASVYAQRWGKRRFMLVGYSFGADAAPFMANRFQAGTPQLAMLGLIAPGRGAQFQFHLSDWMGRSGDETPTAPEMAKLGRLPVACIYGAEEARESLCTTPLAPTVVSHAFQGGHHLSGDYAGVAKVLLDAWPRSPN